ncbi:hypothetical protein SDC9_176158 [bioreactor metagenome]|uniref:Uncharacterized protein n=1 Tax=bioreactor metagenome TaxID=1076179 RepID=A0A645GYL5_9ZZZZ
MQTGGIALKRRVDPDGNRLDDARGHVVAFRHVARGVYVRRARAHGLINRDATADFDAGFAGKLRVGANADGLNEYVARDRFAAG